MGTENRRTFLKKAAATTAVAGLTGVHGRTAAGAESGAPGIVYRDLGSTGYKVSEVGMGCMNMRDAELVRAAIDSGINYIDTANAYMNGQNEEVVGQVMKTERDKVFLTTKVGLRMGLDQLPLQVPRQVETSLQRLQTDHVDLLLLHHGGDTVEQILSDVQMKVLDDARRKGQTRFIGFSTHSSDPAIFDAAIESKFYDAVLLCYNYESPASLTASIEKVRKAGIAVIGMKNLLNFNSSPRAPLADIREDKDGPVTYTQALLKWVLSNPYVDTIIPGMTAFEHLTGNLAVMGTKMGFEDHQRLRRFSGSIRGTHCLQLAGCTGCEGQCPKGVKVCELNRCLGYAYGYGDSRLAWENYRQLPRESRVTQCSDCSECAVKCVNGLDLNRTVHLARNCSPDKLTYTISY